MNNLLCVLYVACFPSMNMLVCVFLKPLLFYGVCLKTSRCIIIFYYYLFCSLCLSWSLILCLMLLSSLLSTNMVWEWLWVFFRKSAPHVRKAVPAPQAPRPSVLFCASGFLKLRCWSTSAQSSSVNNYDAREMAIRLNESVAKFHGAITLSPKDRFDGVCSATVYKPRTLPSLIRCGTFVLMVTVSPTQFCDALLTDGLPAYPIRWALGEISESGLDWLWYHLSRDHYPLSKRPILPWRLCGSKSRHLTTSTYGHSSSTWQGGWGSLGWSSSATFQPTTHTGTLVK